MDSRRGRLGLVAARIAAIATAALLGCSDTEPPPDPAPVNVLLILVDELRSDSVGPDGQTFFDSPCIDRIANEGARFDDAFVITSLCSPSRATVLTGLYTPRHGVRDICTTLNPALPTVATSLQDLGYRNAFVGKSHLNSDGRALAGFDRWLSFAGQGSYVDPMMVEGDSTVQKTGHMTDILTDAALEFLREQNPTQPFFMVLSHLAAHGPWVAQARFAGIYDGVTFDPPASWNEDRSQKPDYFDCRSATQFDSDRIRRYYETLAGVEESTCRLLAQLESMGVLDDTLVLFTSDNGYMLGEHRLLDKRVAYEESIRIPIFARFPTRFAAETSVVGNIALNLDLAPTMVEATGAAPLPAATGIPLWDLAARTRTRDRFLYFYYKDFCDFGTGASCTPGIVALRTLDHALIDNLGTKIEPLDELYDLRTDPEQKINLLAGLDPPAIADSLRAELDRMRIEIEGP